MLRIAIVCCVLFCGLAAAVQLEEVFAWRGLDFAWPTQQDKDKAVQSKQYIADNNLPLGISRWNDKLFVTVPR